MGQKPRIVEIEMAAVQGLVERAKGLLPAEDYDLLKGLVETLLTLVDLVRKGRTTIARLRRLVGFASSEKTANVLEKLGERDGDAADGVADPAGCSEAKPGAEKTTAPVGGEPTTAEAGASPEPGAGAQAATKPKGHGRTPLSAYPDACHFAVLHESLRPGDRCPACGRGTLFELKEPARFLRIMGQPPLVAVCWNCQRLRCSGCGTPFTARAPVEAQGEKHSATAVAMMALLRYDGGMPLNRLDHLQRHLQTPVSASTQWDVVHARVGDVEPVYHELVRLAAQGSVVHNDDTYMRILEFMGKRRADLLRRGALPDPERTGLFTTAIVAIADAGGAIALFFTGRKHAGENLTELLHHRVPGLDPPVLMCDALERNLPTGHKVLQGNCASHARRHFVDEAENFPEECRYLLEMLGRVFKLDEICRTLRLSDEERLRLHQRESGPVMDELKAWMGAQFSEKRIEPNSGMGAAINYMLKRWDKFTLFLRTPGAPLHNNIAERTLKKAIRHRNNSLFYRSQHGARVGDIYMTLIHTCELHGENPFHYLTALMRHAKAVAENSAAWLPWNYRDTLARLAAHEAATEQLGSAHRAQQRPPLHRRARPLTTRAPSVPSPARSAVTVVRDATPGVIQSTTTSG